MLRILLCIYRVYLLTSVLPSLLTFFLLWVMLLFTSFTSSNYCVRSTNINIISRKSREFNWANERRWPMLLTTISNSSWTTIKVNWSLTCNSRSNAGALWRQNLSNDFCYSWIRQVIVENRLFIKLVAIALGERVESNPVKTKLIK